MNHFDDVNCSDDPWGDYADEMVKQLRESLRWLGPDFFVERLADHWPGETEHKPLTPEELEAVIDKWVKEK